MSKKLVKQPKRPDAIYPEPEWDGPSGMEPIECPACGHVAPMLCYDVGGADDGCLFCTQCHTEIRT